ncbi:MAG TPA: TetR/AcrR family transcriptional regulator, partial [bacterium]|nr:TetR/AcrR family transcriptional regulator [bacterium]
RSAADTSTKDRILAAAIDVFARKGYHGAGVEDIVLASGTSKGAFYHYFPSKQTIFLALMDDLAEVVEQGVEAAIGSEHGAMLKVEAALRAVVETAGSRRDLAKILLVEAVGLGPQFEQKRLEIHRRFAQVIRRHLDRAVADGDIPAQDTALVAQAWFGALNEVISQWLISGERLQALSERERVEGPLTSSLPALRTLLLRSIGASNNPGNAGTRERGNAQG